MKLTDLVDRLKITLEHSERGSLTFIVGDTSARRIMVDLLVNELGKEHLSIYDMAVTKINLLAFSEKLPSSKANILVIGFDVLELVERKKILRDINFHRESLRDVGKNFVFLVDQPTADDFPFFAPDLWSIRSGVFDIPKQASFSPVVSGLIRVFSKNQVSVSVGAGFLVDKRRAITCAHIIANSLGMTSLPETIPQVEFIVDFPLVSPGNQLSARVVAWIPKEDLAILEIVGNLPPEVEAVDLIDQSSLQPSNFRAFGFPANYPQGIWANGLIETDAQGRLLLKYSSSTGSTIQAGFSGGPIWDEALQGVVGMIQKVENRPESKVAIGIPINRIVASYKQLASSIPEQLDLVKRRYLDYVRSTYTVLRLRGIRRLNSYSQEMNLQDIYVPLLACPDMPVGETWERRLAGRDVEANILAKDDVEKNSTCLINIEDELEKHPRVVILGDPGSGKTTLLRHLTLSIVTQSDDILPILIPLRAFAIAVNEGPTSLYEFLPRYFIGQEEILGNIQVLFDHFISQGKALIMLDGLDEGLSISHKLVPEIEKFANRVVPNGCRIIVTSRIVGYRKAPFKSTNWSLYTLLDFDLNSIDAFVQKWSDFVVNSDIHDDIHDSKSAAKTKSHELMTAIRMDSGITKLAGNPLFLTILAFTWLQRGELPGTRVRLYDLLLEMMISTWDRVSKLGKRQGELPSSDLELINILAPLALWIRQVSPTTGTVTEESLIQWLMEFYQREGKSDAKEIAYEFLRLVREQSNVLVERGPGIFGFIHLAFEEALAARGLVQLDLDRSLSLIQNHITDPTWHEVIVLAIETLGIVQSRRLLAGEMVRRILEISLEGEDKGTNVLVAGQCLENAGEKGLGRVVANEIQNALIATNQDRSLKSVIQRDAGFILARCGWLPENIDDFVVIHRGSFRTGKGKALQIIENNFLAGKYPVTNLQYKRFIEAGSYFNKIYWDSDGWYWKETNVIEMPMFWSSKKWNNPLSPVIGISWFEAQAYCKWLSLELNKLVYLPSDAQWQRIAHGESGNIYPWGNKFNEDLLNCANYWKNYLSDASTTIVSQFHSGSSPDGVCDLFGNVWEWTSTKHKKDIVVCGGSWKESSSLYATTPVRTMNPGMASTQVGFRVCME